jgi:A/G-specific adenine glycosylase
MHAEPRRIRKKAGNDLVEASPAAAVEGPAEPNDSPPADWPPDPSAFRRSLMSWYTTRARVLPWRGTSDPYQIWLSEIMLQQTRVAAVLNHYAEFLRRFPTLLSLALAADADVLAAWSGLGYYRRARMLHKAAQFIVHERNGELPSTSSELRTLPGIGDYTAAAIASIAFGESIAVVDGNVERVILRLAGRAEEATAAARTFVRQQAQSLIPPAQPTADPTPSKPRARGSHPWNAAERIALAAIAHPNHPAGGEALLRPPVTNLAGDHNQAMMELGATVCLPRNPLCPRCPVYGFCRTRGEHSTLPKTKQRSLPVAFLLELRKRGTTAELLLSLRAGSARVMPAMFELPPLPADVADLREPVLRVRHSIMNTNYYVQVFAQRRHDPADKKSDSPREPQLRRLVPKDNELHWVSVARLGGIPLTGLARKILQRLHVMQTARMNVLG